MLFLSKTHSKATNRTTLTELQATSDLCLQFVQMFTTFFTADFFGADHHASH